MSIAFGSATESWKMWFLSSFFKYFIYLFLETREGREKERERNINVCLHLVCPPLGTWPATQACALTGNQTGNPLVRRLVLKPLSCTSQGKMWFLYLDYSASAFPILAAVF